MLLECVPVPMAEATTLLPILRDAEEGDERIQATFPDPAYWLVRRTLHWRILHFTRNVAFACLQSDATILHISSRRYKSMGLSCAI